MQVGDLVRFNNPASFNRPYGIVTLVDDSHRQTSVYALFDTGLVGPIWEGHLDVISSTLTDDQLDNVMGGMSQKKFNEWRVEKLNEDR